MAGVTPRARRASTVAASRAQTAATLRRPESGQIGVPRPSDARRRRRRRGRACRSTRSATSKRRLPRGMARGDGLRERDARDGHDGDALRLRAERERDGERLLARVADEPEHVARGRGGSARRPCGPSPRCRSSSRLMQALGLAAGRERVVEVVVAPRSPWSPTSPPARRTGSRAVWPVSKWWSRPPATTRSAVSCGRAPISRAASRRRPLERVRAAWNATSPRAQVSHDLHRARPARATTSPITARVADAATLQRREQRREAVAAPRRSASPRSSAGRRAPGAARVGRRARSARGPSA